MICYWASDLLAASNDTPKELKEDLRKIVLAAAFWADSSLDCIQLSTRLRALNMMARCYTWLHSWQVDPTYQVRVASDSFKGVLGDYTDKYLVKDRDKKMLLLTYRKENKPKKRFSSFCESF